MLTVSRKINATCGEHRYVCIHFIRGRTSRPNKECKSSFSSLHLFNIRSLLTPLLFLTLFLHRDSVFPSTLSSFNSYPPPTCLSLHPLSIQYQLVLLPNHLTSSLKTLVPAWCHRFHYPFIPHSLLLFLSRVLFSPSHTVSRIHHIHPSFACLTQRLFVPDILYLPVTLVHLLLHLFKSPFVPYPRMTIVLHTTLYTHLNTLSCHLLDNKHPFIHSSLWTTSVHPCAIYSSQLPVTHFATQVRTSSQSYLPNTLFSLFSIFRSSHSPVTIYVTFTHSYSHP